MPARKVTEEQRDEIAGLKEAGLSSPEIARRMGLSKGSVDYACMLRGADNPAHTFRAIPSSGPMVVKRGNHTVRRFTEKEDMLLIALDLEGVSISEIGRRLDRKPNSISGRLMTLARRDARVEAKIDAKKHIDF